MAESKNTKAGDEKAPAKVAKFRMMLKDKSIIEKGADLSGYPAEKLKEWSEKGFLVEAEDKK